MTLPLVLFLLAVVVPVFFGKVRSTPVWLALQAIALGWNGISQHAEVTAHVLVAFVEILVVRGGHVIDRRREAIPDVFLIPEPA